MPMAQRLLVLVVDAWTCVQLERHGAAGASAVPLSLSGSSCGLLLEPPWGHLGGHGGGHGCCRTRGGFGEDGSGSVFGVKRGREARDNPSGRKRRGTHSHCATRRTAGVRDARDGRADGRAAGWVRTEETRGGGGVGRGGRRARRGARTRASRRRQTLEPERRREEIFPVAPETRRRRAPGGRVGARTAPLLHGSVHARGHGRARREGEGDGRHLRCSAGVLQRMRTRWRGRALLRDARRPHFANGAQRSTDRLVDRSARSFYRKPLTGGLGKSRRRENLFFLAPLR